MSADTTAPSLHELLLEKLKQHPELLAIARYNCARWLREGHSAPERLRQWDALLADAQRTENVARDCALSFAARHLNSKDSANSIPSPEY